MCGIFVHVLSKNAELFLLFKCVGELVAFLEFYF